MKHIKLIGVIGVGGALFLIVFFGLREIQRFSRRPAAGLTGDPANRAPTIRFVKNPQPLPPFAVQDLDGQTLSPAAWSDKVVLLNFWATWCAPCRAEIPDLIKLQNKYDGRLQIVGLSIDTDPPEAVKRFAKQWKMNYPVAIASPELEAKFGGVLGLPTSFLLDTRGRVVQKHIGLTDPALYDMEIQALLGLPLQAKIETFEDTGQVFLSNAKNATRLPGVDLSELNSDQKKAALSQLNEKKCTCNCGLTIAQCRMSDPDCSTAQKLADQVIAGVVGSH